MLEWLEYAPVWLLMRTLGAVPRPLARAIGVGVGRLAYWLWPRLRGVGDRNLRMALPELTERQRHEIVRGVFTTLGRQLADFCQLPRLNAANVADVAVHEGLEHYIAARDAGRGVLFITAHLGGWEIGAAAHALYGYPIHVVVRQ